MKSISKEEGGGTREKTKKGKKRGGEIASFFYRNRHGLGGGKEEIQKGEEGGRGKRGEGRDPSPRNPFHSSKIPFSSTARRKSCREEKGRKKKGEAGRP